MSGQELLLSLFEKRKKLKRNYWPEGTYLMVLYGKIYKISVTHYQLTNSQILETVRDILLYPHNWETVE
jgi:hypothetical protein